MLQLEKLNEIIDNEAAALTWPAEPATLYAPLQYMMDMGGKRLRPRLCLVSYNLFSDDIRKSILSPALALEVLHNFTLIHDDIMDKADIRRGRPTVYKKWNDNVAILSGDTMCIWAFRLLGEAPEDRLSQALDLFTKTTVQVCEGQQYDLDFEDRADVSLDEYLRMIGLKTSVLLACSASLGAVLAGADQTICNGLYDFGYKLGIAFQIQDDLLDSFGDEKTFGKKIGGDILNNKKTWLLIKSRELAEEKDRTSSPIADGQYKTHDHTANGQYRTPDHTADGQYRRALDELLDMSSDEGEKKIAAVQDFYRRMGVDSLAEEAINAYYSEAIASLRNIGLNKEQISRMEGIAESLVKRIR